MIQKIWCELQTEVLLCTSGNPLGATKPVNQGSNPLPHSSNPESDKQEHDNSMMGERGMSDTGMGFTVTESLSESAWRHNESMTEKLATSVRFLCSQAAAGLAGPEPEGVGRRNYISTALTKDVLVVMGQAPTPGRVCETQSILEAFIHLIVSEVTAGGKVHITNFAKFERRICEARDHMNPQTRAFAVTVAAHYKMRFEAMPDLSARLRAIPVEVGLFCPGPTLTTNQQGYGRNFLPFQSDV